MFTRKAFALAGLVLAMTAVSSGAALAGQGGTDRPLKISATGTGVTNLSNGQSSVTLQGNATHFGLYKQTEQGQSIPTGQPGVISFSNTWHSVAANGDALSGTCTGTGTTSDGVRYLLLLNCASTSGTGRFAGASATFGAVVNVTYVKVIGPSAYSEVEVVGAGTITY